MKAAKKGAASTRGMKAKLGRAVYVGDFDEAGRGQHKTSMTDPAKVMENAGQAVKYVTGVVGGFVYIPQGEELKGAEGPGDGMAAVPESELSTTWESASRALQNVTVAAKEFVETMHGEPLDATQEAGDTESAIPPDPGAWGVAAIVEGVYEGLSGPKVIT